MNYRSRIVAMLICVGLAACKEDGGQPSQRVETSTVEPEPMATLAPPTWHVSYYKLLAHPADYNGKRIQLSGVLSIADAQATLYPNLDSFRNSVVVDAIELTFTSALEKKAESLDGEFVAVSGVIGRPEVPHTTYRPLGSIQPVERLLWLSERGARRAYDTRRPSGGVVN
jgi:hypothetical protein